MPGPTFLDLAASIDRILHRNIQWPVRSVSSTPVTVTTLDRVILSDATAGNRVVNLPDATTNSGMFFTVKKVDTSGNSVTVQCTVGGQTIDGATTQVLGGLNDYLSVVSNGTVYEIVSATSVSPTIVFTSPDDLTTTDNALIPWVPGRGQTVFGAFAQVKTAPVGDDITIDINLIDGSDGSTVSTLTTLTIADGDLQSTPVTFTATEVPQNYSLEAQITQIGSGTAGANLTVEVYGTAGTTAAGGGMIVTVTDTFQARMKTDYEGVTNTVTLFPYEGNSIDISGQVITVPDVGLAVNITDHIIDSTGADSGAAPIALNNVYSAYVSNGSASYAPTSVRLSITMPTLVSGVKYLGNSGNALNWRFIGWIGTNPTPKFESSLARRYVVNWYNRRAARMFVCPHYVDDNAGTTYTVTSTTYTSLNGGTDDYVQYISNGEDVCSFVFSAFNNNNIGGVGGRIGLGLNTSAGPFSTAIISSTGTFSTFISGFSHEVEGSPASLQMMCCSPTGGTHITFVADDARNGCTADPAVTFLEGTAQV